MDRWGRRSSSIAERTQSTPSRREIFGDIEKAPKRVPGRVRPLPVFSIEIAAPTTAATVPASGEPDAPTARPPRTWRPFPGQELPLAEYARQIIRRFDFDARVSEFGNEATRPAAAGNHRDRSRVRCHEAGTGRAAAVADRCPGGCCRCVVVAPDDEPVVAQLPPRSHDTAQGQGAADTIGAPRPPAASNRWMNSFPLSRCSWRKPNGNTFDIAVVVYRRPDRPVGPASGGLKVRRMLLPRRARTVREAECLMGLRGRSRGAGQIVTFYSFKGGTGRTMALANVGLDSRGQREAGAGRRLGPGVPRAAQVLPAVHEARGQRSCPASSTSSAGTSGRSMRPTAAAWPERSKTRLGLARRRSPGYR